jgi:CBS domain-containing protein
MTLRHRTVSEIMRAEFVSLNASDKLDFVEQVMGLGRIRHLPVLEQGRLVGIVSNRDLLAASLSKVLAFARERRSSFLSMVEVAEVMTRDVQTVPPETSLEEAARVMLRHKIGSLVVVREDGTPLGLLTETDLVREAYLPGEDR